MTQSLVSHCLFKYISSLLKVPKPCHAYFYLPALHLVFLFSTQLTLSFPSSVSWLYLLPRDTLFKVEYHTESICFSLLQHLEQLLITLIGLVSLSSPVHKVAPQILAEFLRELALGKYQLNEWMNSTGKNLFLRYNCLRNPITSTDYCVWRVE